MHEDEIEFIQGSNCHFAKSVEGFDVHFICFNGHPVAKLFDGMKQDVMIPHHGVPTSFAASALDLSGWDILNIWVDHGYWGVMYFKLLYFELSPP
jgi:hypothetical protein